MQETEPSQQSKESVYQDLQFVPFQNTFTIFLKVSDFTHHFPIISGISHSDWKSLSTKV